MRKFLDQSAFHDAARAGRAGGASVLRLTDGDPIPIAGTRKVRFCFSDGSIDRMGDTISAAGWDLTAFNRNPVSLWAHDSSAPPIGRASRLAVENGKLMGDIDFADAATYDFADQVYRLVKAGFVNAVSVGFIPTKYKFSDDKDRPYGIDFLEQELLEISVCPVPANGNALVEGRGMTHPGEATRYVKALALHRGLSGSWPGADYRTDGEREAAARRLARRHLADMADTSTATGRVAHAKRLAAAHLADGGLETPDPAVVMAEAVWRMAPRW